ncbi:glyoxalase/bleomycin resistance/dioxygenase family protein [Aquimarina algiphila]|uniref:Glyoxalase/bleomycin resistance/dioxygenase family protein n=1 Tax=Aquimarina algiphila TaxID=2047982 RepID=A0A554VAE3_9FLAO|nr:glyoxalase/bleomycin resistance/dioxygenase family protein [Aquimarina algiphila]TSE03052.1 glyoxalase/bleomycin resistance/dioxygenase family protein [Aquimarina algiphila]
MDIKRTGHILYVRKYKECILFYSTVLKLDILFQNKELTCFDFFGTYLMIEKEDRADYLNLGGGVKKAFSCIRMHVINVKEIVLDLSAEKIPVEYQEHSWGVVAKFFDPDGNLLAFKDEETFAKQIKEYIK